MTYRNHLIELPQNRVWRSYLGGRTLDELAGKEGPRDSHYPEDWIASVTPANNPGSRPDYEGISTVRVNGREWLFSDLVAQDPVYFLGADQVARFGNKPMVLVKLLDSATRLQLQAHPSAEFARAHLDSHSGKAEAYYILGMREDIDEGYVYLGFQRPPGRDEFKRCVEAQDLAAMESWFDRISVRPGDTLFIPGGVPHAIGEGIFMVEIMEPSDLVVRFEYTREGYTLPESARFMNRDLDFCLDIFDFEARTESQVRRDNMYQPRLETEYSPTARRYHLLGAETTPCFQVKKSVITGAVEREESSYFTGVVTAGRCVLKTSESAIALDTFGKFFCPAGLGRFIIEADEEVQILECFPPA
jgi:mannose-6-phosphate isomerase